MEFDDSIKKSSAKRLFIHWILRGHGSRKARINVCYKKTIRATKKAGTSTLDQIQKHTVFQTSLQ